MTRRPSTQISPTSARPDSAGGPACLGTCLETSPKGGVDMRALTPGDVDPSCGRRRPRPSIAPASTLTAKGLEPLLTGFTWASDCQAPTCLVRYGFGLCCTQRPSVSVHRSYKYYGISGHRNPVYPVRYLQTNSRAGRDSVFRISGLLRLWSWPANVVRIEILGPQTLVLDSRAGNCQDGEWSSSPASHCSIDARPRIDAQGCVTELAGLPKADRGDGAVS